eukprot:Skav222172  [mRNA]  locus=scaffold3048:245752:255313:- [translate_table: standard]
MACMLLGLGPKAMMAVLRFREMKVNRQGRTSTIKCPRPVGCLGLWFAKKKLRAFAQAIELVAYLQKVVLQGKRERTYAGLRRAIRFMVAWQKIARVRVNRWKNRALKRLAPFCGMDEQQEAIFTRRLEPKGTVEAIAY